MVRTEDLVGSHSVLIDSETKLANIDSHLSQGDVAYVAQPETPYRTSGWIDITTDDTTIIFESRFARDGQPIVKVADGANVGGVRIGVTQAVSDVRVEKFGYHGNDQNQDQSVHRLHGLIVGADAERVVVEQGYYTRTSPYHLTNEGGCGITVRTGAQSVTIRDIELDDYGYRGVQVAGQDLLIENIVTRNEFDRSLSLATKEDDPSGNSDFINYGAQDVIVDGVYSLGPRSTPASVLGGGEQDGQNSYDGAYTISNVVGKSGAVNSRLIVLGSNLSNLPQDVSIRGCIGYDCGLEMIGVGGERFNIANNVLINPGGIGIACGAEDSVVSGDIVRDATNQGIRIGTQDCSVNGNRIINPERTGIQMGQRRIVAANNHIRNAGSHGINLDTQRLARGNLIFQSQEHGVTTHSGFSAIVGNFIRDSNQSGDGFDEINVGDQKMLVAMNSVIIASGSTIFNETSGGDRNLWIGNWAPSKSWSLSGTSTRAFANYPNPDGYGHVVTTPDGSAEYEIGVDNTGSVTTTQL